MRSSAAGGARFGRPDGFQERQVDWWTSLFEQIRVLELEGIDVVTG